MYSGSDAGPLEPEIFGGRRIGVWRLLAPDVAPKTADWQFDSPQMLRDELLRAWREAILPYVIPLQDQVGRLESLIAEQDDERRRKDTQIMDDRLLRFARTQFAERRYGDAVGAYEELDDDRLTAADRKRLDIARRRR